jgi:hypothetical protein
MKSGTHSKRSLGQQIICGLSVGCIALIIMELLQDMGYRHIAIHISYSAAQELWEGTGMALFLSSLVLLLASGVMSFYKPKVAFWGMIISLIGMFVAYFTPNFIRA